MASGSLRLILWVLLSVITTLVVASPTARPIGGFGAFAQTARGQYALGAGSGTEKHAGSDALEKLFSIETLMSKISPLGRSGKCLFYGQHKTPTLSLSHHARKYVCDNKGCEKIRSIWVCLLDGVSAGTLCVC
jgi:hypothetical protein